MTGKNELTLQNLKIKFKFKFQQNPQMKSRIFQDSLRTSTSQISVRCLEQEEMRDPPEKIRQNKFTKTYSKIQYIPLQKHIETLNPKSIQHLYLSHNRIKSLSGIQQFDNLVSLNVSYNLLSKIQELQLIQKPQNIVRIGLKMNDFIYGYQDYAVNFFKNLKKLDDIDVKDKKKVKKLQQKGNQVANLFLQFHIRTSRLFVFLDDLIEQQKLHSEMKLKRSQKSKINPKLKLLFEHMTQNYIAKISQNYILPSQEDFIHLSTSQILDKIEKTITNTLEEQVNLKCTCRPRIPYVEQVKKSFKQICQQFQDKFELRYNKQLRNGLNKMKSKLNSKLKFRKFENWELWGMLQNYSTLSLGGKCYEKITSTIGKNHVQLNNLQDVAQNKKVKRKRIEQNQWRNKVFLDQQNSQNDKQNQCPNIVTQSKSVKNHKNYQEEKIEEEDFKIFYDRIPIILYEKNYVQVLLQITMDIIKDILEKYDYLNKARTNYLKSVQKIKNQQQRFLSLDQIYNIVSINNTMNSKMGVQHQSSQFHQKQNIFQNKKSYSHSQSKQNIFKATKVQNSPLDKNDHISAKTTQRKFLKRQESQISFGVNRENQFDFQTQNQKRNIYKNKIDKVQALQKDYSIYEINLIYKVFRAFKIKILKKRNKTKNNIDKSNR